MVLRDFDDIKFTREQFRKLIGDHPEDRALLSALAVEDETDEVLEDTALRTMSGAGHQHFLGFARYLAENARPEELPGCLFRAWRYENEGYSLRWDAADYRPHALRGLDPSKDKLQSVWWANRLAFASLPLLPCYPGRRRAVTAGFDEKRNETFLYPVWRAPLNVDVVRTLIPMAREFKGKEQCRQRGIEAIYEAARFTEGKFRNFSTGRRLT